MPRKTDDSVAGIIGNNDRRAIALLSDFEPRETDAHYAVFDDWPRAAFHLCAPAASLRIAQYRPVFRVTVMAQNTIDIERAGGLVMRVRRYAGGDKTPVVCIPGLTRNASDFADVAAAIAPTGRDVVAVNLRGRGASDYDPEYANYFPPTYRDDILAMLDKLQWREAIFIGTSLGGIVTMLTNEKAPARVKAAVINDIGPDLAPEGLARIAQYVGESAEAGPAADLKEAAARAKAINGSAFPDASDADWEAFARRIFREQADGRWALDYDPNIVKALSEQGPAPDLWPGFVSLKSKPTLLVHGAISDLLTADIVDKMRAVHPAFDYVKVPRVGHAPMLTEPAAREALAAFLAALD